MKLFNFFSEIAIFLQGLKFGFINHIISPYEAYMKIKRFTHTFVDLVVSPYSDVFIKAHKTAVRNKAIKMIVILVKSGGANDRNMIGTTSIVRFGSFIKKLNLTPKMLNLSKICEKDANVSMADLRKVIIKMECLAFRV